MSIDLATLAKLALFERCTDEEATLALYRAVMEGNAAGVLLSPPDDEKLTELPPSWQPHADFIARWRGMEPIFDDVDRLKPAVFLSRDVMAPARARFQLSDGAKNALESLLKVSSVNSPAAATIVESLSATDLRVVMTKLIDEMREADWTKSVPGSHGAIILSRRSAEARDAFRAFASTLQIDSMHKGMKYLLQTSGILEGSS
jgi:hypothetical protein